jgi:AraC-like DNA-binding protein
MTVRSYPVRDVLGEFVESIHFLSGKEMGTGVAFPRMHQVIIINLGSAFRTADVYRLEAPPRAACDGIWINGKQDKPFQLTNDGVTSMYAIGLKLGMVPYFAGLPAIETNNMTVGAEDWGTGSRLRASEIALLREQLMECSVEEGFVLIEQYLHSLVRGSDLSRLRKVQWLGAAMYSRPVEEMCRVLGVTRKRLRNEAQYYFGDSVKNIQGIIRLNQMLGKIAATTIGDGGPRGLGAAETLSALHVYFDQSHFIRDFKARTGITPSQYRLLCRNFPLIGRTPNFLPMTRETFLQFISGQAG